MRKTVLLTAAGLISTLGSLTSSADPLNAASALTRPERTLTCNPGYPGGCKVSCVNATGQTLFVHGDVQKAFITEFAGNHTLVEIQKAGDIISVLVGDVSHCTMEGLRDTGLL
jgi:hypothetical protein